jgi:hypothetical protein
VSAHKARRRWTRANVCWYVLGFVAVQLVLGTAVEWAGTDFRDPIFTRKRKLLAARHADAPGRPLLLALGSSRLLMGLDTGGVTRADGRLLAFNFGDLGAGPMLEQIYLRRLLADGLRPDVVLLEIVPMQLATGIGVTGEQTRLDPARVTWAEMNAVAPNYRYPVTAYARWLKTRGLACLSKQQEIHDALGVDAPRVAVPPPAGEDDYGFGGYPTPPAQERAAGIRDHLARFRPQLAGSRLAKGPARAVRDLVSLCRAERLPFTVILMPECSGLRDLHTPEFQADLDGLFGSLQAEGAFELIDARTWVGDDGFWDGHHLHVAGAQAFTERFIREALPRLKQHLAH